MVAAWAAVVGPAVGSAHVCSAACSTVHCRQQSLLQDLAPRKLQHYVKHINLGG